VLFPINPAPIAIHNLTATSATSDEQLAASWIANLRLEHSRTNFETTVFYSCPQSGVRDAPIIIAMHGIDRAAAEFRDLMASQCARNGQIVLVPEFDTHQFPDFYAYNFGGVRLPPPSNTVLPRKRWNFAIIDRLFAHVRDSIDSNRRSFGLFGNSAGKIA